MRVCVCVLSVYEVDSGSLKPSTDLFLKPTPCQLAWMWLCPGPVHVRLNLSVSFLLTAIVRASLLSRSFRTAAQNTQPNIIVVFELDFQWSHSSIHELFEKKTLSELDAMRGRGLKKTKKHMNLNEALLQPWWPNHVTNQTLPSHLSKSNWPFPTAQLCDTDSAPRALSLSLSPSISISISFSLCLCLPVFSQAGAETPPPAGWCHRGVKGEKI